MTLFTVDNRVGRVVEARVFSLPTRADADAYSRALADKVISIPARLTPVLCADHRPVKVYSQPVADRLVELFTEMNTRLSRVAILASRTNATLTLQLERLVRTAAFAGRRVLYLPSEALTHFSGTLDEAELERIRSFLSEFNPSSTPN